MLHRRTEPPASALARGATKAEDIESTRRDLDRVRRRAARALIAATATYGRELARGQHAPHRG